MNYWTFYVLIVCLSDVHSKYLYQKDPHGSKRGKRYAIQKTPYPIPTLSTTSTHFPIPTLDSFMNFAKLNGSQLAMCPLTRKRRETLSDDHLLRILDAHGGSFNPTLMAVNKTHARKNFPNLLPIIPRYFSNNGRSMETEIITKLQISEDIVKWRAYLRSLLWTNSNKDKQYSNVTQDFILDKLSQFIRDKGTEHNMYNTPPYSVLYALGEYLVDNEDHRTILHLVKSSNISVHPRILQKLSTFGKRKKRYVEDASSSVEYCITKGTEQPDGFVDLCSTCAVTTTLGSDKFPRLINEVICSHQDKTCLNMRNTPHGACKETSLQMKFLRTVPGGCRMMIRNNREIVVDEWETYIQPIRTGCSCEIDKRSYLIQRLFPVG